MEVFQLKSDDLAEAPCPGGDSPNLEASLADKPHEVLFLEPLPTVHLPESVGITPSCDDRDPPICPINCSIRGQGCRNRDGANG